LDSIRNSAISDEVTGEDGTKYAKQAFTMFVFPDYTEIKIKVATSNVEILDASNFIGTGTGKFTWRTIGSDDERRCFLTYNGPSDNPSRFATKETTSL
jgi:hypothetical protein